MTSAAGTSVSSMMRAVVSRPAGCARAVDEEAGQRDDEQDLAELGGLEGEERAARSRGASRGRREPSAWTARIEPISSAVDAVLELAQPRVVDRATGQRRRRARRRSRRPGGRRSSAGRRRCRPRVASAIVDERARAQARSRRAAAPGRTAGAAPSGSVAAAGPRGRVAADVADGGRLRGHGQSRIPALAMKRVFWSNHCASMQRAAGAAASAPKPPCSTVTATTIGLLAVAARSRRTRTGRRWPARWAVPVLP